MANLNLIGDLDSREIMVPFSKIINQEGNKSSFIISCYIFDLV